MQVLDWEVAQAYRQWRRKYPSSWEQQMHSKFYDEFTQKQDLCFFLGTTLTHPDRWTIIGLFYPPKEQRSEVPSANMQHLLQL